MKKMVLLFAIACFCTAVPAMADTLKLGDIFFSTGVSVNGVDGNEFVLDNLTGDCTLIGVCTAADFNNVVIVLTPSGGSPYTVNLGTVPSDSTEFSTALFAPLNVTFSLATLTGNSSVTTFLLQNGDKFVASSDQIFATFSSPTVGASAPILIEGTEVSGTVPEPSSAVLTIGGLAMFWIGRRRLGFNPQA
jgi:hypothetical protein